jgi:hypothetical protein
VGVVCGAGGANARRLVSRLPGAAMATAPSAKIGE